MPLYLDANCGQLRVWANQPSNWLHIRQPCGRDLWQAKLENLAGQNDFGEILIWEIELLILAPQTANCWLPWSSHTNKHFTQISCKYERCKINIEQFCFNFPRISQLTSDLFIFLTYLSALWNTVSLPSSPKPFLTFCPHPIYQQPRHFHTLKCHKNASLTWLLPLIIKQRLNYCHKSGILLHCRKRAT